MYQDLSKKLEKLFIQTSSEIQIFNIFSFPRSFYWIAESIRFADLGRRGARRHVGSLAEASPEGAGGEDACLP